MFHRLDSRLYDIQLLERPLPHLAHLLANSFFYEGRYPWARDFRHGFRLNASLNLDPVKPILRLITYW